jgi:O-antigen/teichoic acid export membrane protein
VTERSLSERTARNALFSAAAFAYPTVLTLIVLPVVLREIGPEAYGIFALATVFVGFLGLLALGTGPAVVKFVSEHSARDEADAVNEVVGTGILIYGAAGICGLGVALAAAEFLLEPAFGLFGSALADARFVFVVAGVGFFFTMPRTVLTAIPQALQRYDVSTMLTLALATVTAGGFMIAVLAGWGVRGLIVVAAGEQVAGTFAFAVASRWLVPTLRLRPRLRRSSLRRMWSFSVYTFAGNVSGLLLFHLGKLLLGALGTVTMVTYYAVPGSIAQRLHAAAVGLTSVTLPATSALEARGESERVRRLYVRATRLSTLLLASIALPMILLADPLLSAWIGQALAAESANVLRLLAVAYAFLGVAAAPYFIALGADRARSTAVASGAMAALNVPLALMLIPRAGATGAAAAFLLSTLPILVFIGYVERGVLGLRRSPWGATGVRVGVPLALQVAACVALEPFADRPAAVLAILLLVIPLPSVAYFALRTAPEEDRELVARVVRRAPAARPDP